MEEMQQYSNIDNNTNNIGATIDDIDSDNNNSNNTANNNSNPKENNELRELCTNIIMLLYFQSNNSSQVKNPMHKKEIDKIVDSILPFISKKYNITPKKEIENISPLVICVWEEKLMDYNVLDGVCQILNIVKVIVENYLTEEWTNLILLLKLKQKGVESVK